MGIVCPCGLIIVRVLAESARTNGLVPVKCVYCIEIGERLNLVWVDQIGLPARRQGDAIGANMYMSRISYP